MIANNKITILVIEDNVGICNMMARILIDSGYQVNMAYDGASGIEASKKEPPGLLLLDINLPHIAGAKHLPVWV